MTSPITQKRLVWRHLLRGSFRNNRAPMNVVDETLSQTMSGWLVEVETSGKGEVPPPEWEGVARSLFDEYAAWHEKEADAIKAVDRKFGPFRAGTIKAKSPMSDEDLRKNGLNSVGDVKFLRTRPF